MYRNTKTDAEAYRYSRDKETRKRLLKNILNMHRTILSALAFEERTIEMGYSYLCGCV